MNSEVIAIAHAGGDDDLNIIDRITRCLHSTRTKAVPRLEYQQYLPPAHRELAIARNIKRYGEQNMALIVILSMTFFETVWPTSAKPSILNEILNYKNNRCLHVWAADLSLVMVRRFSTSLTRSAQSFRSVLYEKLEYMIVVEAAQEICSLLNTVVHEDEKYAMNYPAKGVLEEAALLSEKKKFVSQRELEEYEDTLHNLPMHQEEEQIPQRNQPFQSRPPTAANPHRQQSQRVKNSGPPREYVGDVALNMIGISAAATVQHPQPNLPQAVPTTRINNKKKNRNKAKRASNQEPVDENELLLSEVKYFHLFELSDRLDQSSLGADYRRIAAMYSFSRDDIEQLGLARLRGQRPTEQLIRGLNTRYPDLKMKDFENRCTEIKRMDVVKYIREKIYNI